MFVINTTMPEMEMRRVPGYNIHDVEAVVIPIIINPTVSVIVILNTVYMLAKILTTRAYADTVDSEIFSNNIFLEW